MDLSTEDFSAVVVKVEIDEDNRTGDMSETYYDSSDEELEASNSQLDENSDLDISQSSSSAVEAERLSDHENDGSLGASQPNLLVKQFANKKGNNSGFFTKRILAKNTKNGNFKFFKKTKLSNLLSKRKNNLTSRNGMEKYKKISKFMKKKTVTSRSNQTDDADVNDDQSESQVDSVCPVCNKKFASLFTMRRHIRSIHERIRTESKTDNVKKQEYEYFCELCGKDFSTRYTLKRHNYRAHCPDRKFRDSQKEAKIYTCKYDGCPKVFSNSSNCKKHFDAVHLNLRKHLCEICSYMFKTKGALRSHMNTCHEKDPLKSHMYECNICLKRFTSKGKLTMHETVHTNLKPYNCTFEDCGRSFRLKHNLHKHINVHRNVKPYVCLTCNQGFTRKVYLQTHQYKHTGMKNYKCLVCEKMFSQQGNLNIHMKTHGQQYTPYMCKVCSKSYTTKASLVKHMLCHSKNSPGGNIEDLMGYASKGSVSTLDTEKIDHIILANATEENEFEMNQFS